MCDHYLHVRHIHSVWGRRENQGRLLPYSPSFARSFESREEKVTGFFFIDDDMDDVRMKITFVSQPPLEGSMWWINLAFSPVSPRQARTLITCFCNAFEEVQWGHGMLAMAGLWNLLTAGGQSIVMKFKFLCMGK